MAQGKTLFERIQEHFNGPEEVKFFNPIAAKIGGSLNLNWLEYSDLHFVINQIDEYRRTINGKQFYFTDYTIASEDIVLRLRVIPNGKQSTALILKLDYESDYDEDLDDTLEEETGVFEQTIDDKVLIYNRVDGITSSYLAMVTSLTDDNGDGKITEDEAEKRKIKYWDFARSLEELNDFEYLFIEKDLGFKDEGTGRFQFWQGRMIDTSQVSV